MDAGFGSNHGSKPEVLDVMLFSFVICHAWIYPTTSMLFGPRKLTLAVLKALSLVFVRLWLLPKPGSIGSARYIIYVMT